jgi:hypothetical protein
MRSFSVTLALISSLSLAFAAPVASGERRAASYEPYKTPALEHVHEPSHHELKKNHDSHGHGDLEHGNDGKGGKLLDVPTHILEHGENEGEGSKHSEGKRHLAADSLVGDVGRLASRGEEPEYIYHDSHNSHDDSHNPHHHHHDHDSHEHKDSKHGEGKGENLLDIPVHVLKRSEYEYEDSKHDEEKRHLAADSLVGAVGRLASRGEDPEYIYHDSHKSHDDSHNPHHHHEPKKDHDSHEHGESKHGEGTGDNLLDVLTHILKRGDYEREGPKHSGEKREREGQPRPVGRPSAITGLFGKRGEEPEYIYHDSHKSHDDSHNTHHHHEPVKDHDSHEHKESKHGEGKGDNLLDVLTHILKRSNYEREGPKQSAEKRDSEAQGFDEFIGALTDGDILGFFGKRGEEPEYVYHDSHKSHDDSHNSHHHHQEPEKDHDSHEHKESKHGEGKGDNPLDVLTHILKRGDYEREGSKHSGEKRDSEAQGLAGFIIDPLGLLPGGDSNGDS